MTMRSPSGRRIGLCWSAVAIVDRLADPDAALVVDVDAGGVAEAADLLGRPQGQFQAVGVDGEGGQGLVRGDLGAGDGRDEEERDDEKQARPRLHGSRRLHGGRAIGGGNTEDKASIAVTAGAPPGISGGGRRRGGMSAIPGPTPTRTSLPTATPCTRGPGRRRRFPVGAGRRPPRSLQGMLAPALLPSSFP